MSMCVLGMSEEFKEYGIAVNALWPKTAIETAAIDLIGSSEMRKQCRKADIMADAAYLVLSKNSRTFTGNFLIDENVLRKEGVKDFDHYSVVPGSELLLDFFLDDEHLVEGKDVASKDENTKAQVSYDHLSDLTRAVKKINNLISEDLVNKTKAIYTFKFPGTYFLLKN